MHPHYFSDEEVGIVPVELHMVVVPVVWDKTLMVHGKVAVVVKRVVGVVEMVEGFVNPLASTQS